MSFIIQALHAAVRNDPANGVSIQRRMRVTQERETLIALSVRLDQALLLRDLEGPHAEEYEVTAFAAFAVALHNVIVDVCPVIGEVLWEQARLLFDVPELAIERFREALMANSVWEVTAVLMESESVS